MSYQGVENSVAARAGPLGPPRFTSAWRINARAPSGRALPFSTIAKTYLSSGGAQGGAPCADPFEATFASPDIGFLTAWTRSRLFRIHSSKIRCNFPCEPVFSVRVRCSLSSRLDLRRFGFCVRRKPGSVGRKRVPLRAVGPLSPVRS